MLFLSDLIQRIKASVLNENQNKYLKTSIYKKVNLIIINGNNIN